MKKIVIGIGIVLFFLIIPIEYLNFTTREVSTNKVAYDKTFPSIAYGNTVSQQFVPQYDFIKRLEIYVREVKCDVSQGYLQFRILDAGKNSIYEVQVPLEKMASSGWYTVFSDIELIAGETYYLNVDAVETLDDGPGLGFFASIDTASKEEEGQKLTYAGSVMENRNLKVSFEYLKPLYKWDYLAYYLFMIFIIAKVLFKYERVL